MATVDFGLMLRPSDARFTFDELITFNQMCIQALSEGFSTLWMEDHLQWGATESLECLSTLAYLAGMYPRFTIGTLVLAQSYRNPALVAKMAANLHALTGGRIILGLGAGWKEDEYRAYGYPFPPVKTRLEQLEEAAQIMKSMWQTQPATLHGQHYHIQNAYCSPQPTPNIPLLIGGGGEQRTLAIVARYADWWNFNSCPPEDYARKATILKQHCERIGRDFSEITLSYLGTVSVASDPAQVARNPQKHFVAGTADEVIREIEQFHAIGVTHFMFRFLDIPTLEYFVSHVVPHFQ